MSKLKHISWPKTGAFKNMKFELGKLWKPKFSHLDENGQPVFGKPTMTEKVLTFEGTVKLHGANASIVNTSKDDIYCQSRNKAFSLECTDALNGWVSFVNENKDAIVSLINQHKPQLQDNQYFVLFGEWAGPGIQKGVGISQMENKKFFIFNTMVLTEGEVIEEDVKTYIPNKDIKMPEIGIYNIYDSPTYKITIDFSDREKVEDAVEKMTQYTMDIEKECPVSKEFGINGVGEGLVWSTVPFMLDINGKPLSFKTKGEKHKGTNTKKLVEIDEVTLQKVSDFIDYACTENRLNQCISEVLNGEVNIKLMGKAIGWMAKDIMKEESNALEANGLDRKMVTKEISKRVREMFMNRL